MGAVKASLVGLDTNIFIYYFHQHRTFGPFSRRIVEALVSDDLKAVTSILTLSELLSLQAHPSRVRSLQETFFQLPNLLLVSVDQEITLKAADVRREYRFPLPDALQLSTAIQAKADFFISHDRKLARFKDLRVVPLRQALQMLQLTSSKTQKQ